MKRIISISALLLSVLFVTIIFASQVSAEGEEIHFTDVGPDDYFYEYRTNTRDCYLQS